MNKTQGAGKILIFSGVQGDTRRYRSLHLYEQLRLAGADCILSHLTDPRLMEYVGQASAAVLHRVALDGYVKRVFHALRRRGALIVLDADDFLYDPAIMRWIDSPDFQDPVRAALYRREILRHRAALERCDAVTVSTGALGEMIAPAGKPVFTHRNAYSLEMLFASQAAGQAAQKNPNRVVIGYASGTPTHDKDFAMIRPILERLMRKHAQVELWLMGPVGSGTEWGDLGGRVRSFPLVPWRALPARLAALDINLAPLLPQSPFNQAKSEIKFMEAALTRVPTVASSTDAFRHAIRQGQTGFLAESAEDWASALERLIASKAERQSIGLAAYEDVLARYAPAARGADYLRILEEAAGQVGVGFTATRAAVPPPPAPGSFFTAEMETRPTMLDLAKYSIRHRGPLTLLGQAWVFFRRKLAPIIPFRGAGES